VLDGALAQCLPLDEVMKVPALGRLLALTTAQRTLDTDVVGLTADLERARAVPGAGITIAVALQALRSSESGQVLRGLRALERLKPACAKERVRTLLGAGTQRVHLREAADQTLRVLPARTTPLAGLEELLRDTPLFETVREVAPEAAKAETVDDWFEHARPVWRAWWTLSEAGPPTEAVWRARTNEFLHFIESRRLHPRGRSLVQVKGPSSVRCELSTGEEVVTAAQLPLHHEGDVAGEVVHLSCGHPANARLLDQSFAFEPGDELTIEVLAP
jgi:hypothetical protein